MPQISYSYSIEHSGGKSYVCHDLYMTRHCTANEWLIDSRKILVKSIGVLLRGF